MLLLSWKPLHILYDGKEWINKIWFHKKIRIDPDWTQKKDVVWLHVLFEQQKPPAQSELHE